MTTFSVKQIEESRILKKAAHYLNSKPITVTAHQCERSQGGRHDFYSEGDYWWPNPDDPDGPYIQRDGESNPNLFNAHRQAMIRLSDIIGTLTSTYLISNEQHDYSAKRTNQFREINDFKSISDQCGHTIYPLEL